MKELKMIKEEKQPTILLHMLTLDKLETNNIFESLDKLKVLSMLTVNA